MKGLGDIVEALIPDIIKPKECKGCAERKERLNKQFPLPIVSKRILQRRKRQPK